MSHQPTPDRALIVVDVQNDFCEGGSLAVHGGADVAGGISAFLRDHDSEYRLLIATRDWHIRPGDHFSTGTTESDATGAWPPHCVADTPGADFHPNVNVAVPFERTVDAIVSKGQYSAAYSGFEGTDPEGHGLLDLCRAAKVRDLDVCGIATDHCVRATVLDGIRHGFGVRVLLPLCAGVAEDTTRAAVDEMRSAGAEVLTALPDGSQS